MRGRTPQAWVRHHDRYDFMGMWILMMLEMMLPSLVPMLASYRRAMRVRHAARLGRLKLLAGAGYFAVWSLIGAAAYPVGVLLGAAEMEWEGVARAVPLAAAGVLLAAGVVQLTAWKARQLQCCWDARAVATRTPRTRRAPGVTACTWVATAACAARAI